MKTSCRLGIGSELHATLKRIHDAVPFGGFGKMLQQAAQNVLDQYGNIYVAKARRLPCGELRPANAGSRRVEVTLSPSFSEALVGIAPELRESVRRTAFGMMIDDHLEQAFRTAINERLHAAQTALSSKSSAPERNPETATQDTAANRNKTPAGGQKGQRSQQTLF